VFGRVKRATDTDPPFRETESALPEGVALGNPGRDVWDLANLIGYRRGTYLVIHPERVGMFTSIRSGSASGRGGSTDFTDGASGHAADIGGDDASDALLSAIRSPSSA
jgi:hypothetical protein